MQKYRLIQSTLLCALNILKKTQDKWLKCLTPTHLVLLVKLAGHRFRKFSTVPMKMKCCICCITHAMWPFNCNT